MTEHLVYIPSAKLDHVTAPNFTMREVARSNTAARLGIDNTPPVEVLINARALAANVLQPLRNHYGRGFSPNSWYRGEALEKVVAARGYQNWLAKYGYEDSLRRWKQYFQKKQHPTGMAADIEIPGVSNDELYDYIKRNMMFDQLIREFPKPGDPMSGWVHVSFQPQRDQNRGMSFTIG